MQPVRMLSVDGNAEHEWRAAHQTGSARELVGTIIYISPFLKKKKKNPALDDLLGRISPIRSIFFS